MTYYTSAFSLRHSRAATSNTMRRNRNAVRFNKTKEGLGPISNTITLALILCLLGLMYLTQITKQSTYGYDLNALQTQHTELINEQESLEVESARLQALDRIKNSKVAKQLEEPANVEFAR